MLIKLEDIPKNGRSDRDWIKAAFDMAGPGDTITMPPRFYDLGLKESRPKVEQAGFRERSPA
jgi:hypothetical protein